MHVNIIIKENKAINLSTEKMEGISGRLAVRDQKKDGVGEIGIILFQLKLIENSKFKKAFYLV